MERHTIVSQSDEAGRYSARIGTPRSRCPCRRTLVTLGFALGGATSLAAPSAWAGPGDSAAQKGLAIAKGGDCVKAIPLLEEAERARRRPASGSALAECYVKTGELIRASEIYRQIEKERSTRGWSRADTAASKLARNKAAEVDARIPTIRFETPEDYAGLEVEVAGKPIKDPKIPMQVPPDVSTSIEIRAPGRQPFSDKIILNERERRKVRFKLEPIPIPALEPTAIDLVEEPYAEDYDDPNAPLSKGALPPPPPTWLGARFRSALIPQGALNLVADGGRTVFAPGAGVTFTMPFGDVEAVVSLGYLSYAMPSTPFKPRNAPDTEWEFIASSLQALTASVDLFWNIQLDRRRAFTFKVGGGLGVGWTFTGDMYRNQVYPGSNAKAGDPSTYTKCVGPNNPVGQFKYCNALDKDATHYGNYAEPSWFAKGIRPLIFPWLVAPELGLTWRVQSRVAIDVGVGLSLSGIITDFGVRFAL
jgi:hypothetical protein